MHFAQILSDCLEAVAHGESIESCLALHPDHAEELAPLLQLATSLQAQPTRTLSAQAFQQGRAALADAARARSSTTATETTATEPLPSADSHTQHRRFVPYRDRPAQVRRGATSPLPTSVQPSIAPILAAPPTTQRRQARRVAVRNHVAASRLRQMVAVALSLILILTTATLLRQTALSTPGSPLYALKTATEEGQGMLMIAAGEGASWHANQMLRRLGELAQITTAAPLTAEPTTSALTTSLADRAALHADQALATGALLPAEDQRSFLLAWLTRLEKTEQTLQRAATPSTEALALLQKTKRAVLAATAALEDGPVELPARELLLDTPTAAVETATALPVATVQATATTPQRLSTRINLLPTATRVLHATAIPTATQTPAPRLPTLSPPTMAPTITPLPVLTQVMPMEQQSNLPPAEDSATNNRSSTDEADAHQEDEREAEPREPTPTNRSENDSSESGSGRNDEPATPTPSITEDDDTDSGAATPTWLPTASSGEGIAATVLPTEPIALPSVEAEMTISAPRLPTAAATVEPARTEEAPTTPVVAQRTSIALDEGPLPILVTMEPPTSPATTMPTTMPTSEERATADARPTRTRRSTATPAATAIPAATSTPAATKLPATSTPEATASPASDSSSSPATATAPAEPTDIIAP